MSVLSHLIHDNDSVRWMPLSVLFYKYGNWGSERFRNLFNVTQQVLAPQARKSGRLFNQDLWARVGRQKIPEAFVAALCVRQVADCAVSMGCSGGL